MSFRSDGYNFRTSPSGLIVPVVDETGAVPDITDVSFDIDLPGGTSNFLREDGTWQVPPGSGATLAVLFDSTVAGSDAAIIDTGAAGIATTYNLIEVWLYLRTDEAVALSAVDVRVNNDSSAIYDRNFAANTNTTVSGGVSLAQTAWTFNAAGASAAAGVWAAYRITIVAYAQTTGWKVGEFTGGVLDTTAANTQWSGRTFQYRATTAISRMSVAANTAAKKLKIGSRMIIYGR